ncbi:MAG TPA: hypothetical protein ENI76_11040 [Ignavibacteria bacterium]|nr:hypothetical protein [Ignavibacteria bacterium]
MQDSIEETRLTIALDSARGQDAFKDVDSVVNNAAFDLKVSELAQAYTDQYGGDLIENGQSLTDQIWAMPNPYTYMYGLIKGESPDEKSGGNSQKPVDAPGSLANTGGGVDNKGSAQAKMIDDMSEMELSEALSNGKIKQETYDAYLKGELVET